MNITACLNPPKRILLFLVDFGWSYGNLKKNNENKIHKIQTREVESQTEQRMPFKIVWNILIDNKIIIKQWNENKHILSAFAFAIYSNIVLTVSV